MITLEQAAGAIGEGVVYRSGSPTPESGVITSVNQNYIFVRFGADLHSEGVYPTDLNFERAQPRECDDERTGPSSALDTLRSSQGLVPDRLVAALRSALLAQNGFETTDGHVYMGSRGVVDVERLARDLGTTMRERREDG